MRELQNFKCKMTPSVSGTDQHCYKGKGVHAQRNDRKSENAIFFLNFLRVSQELLATIVWYEIRRI